MTDRAWACEVRVLSGGTEHKIGGRVADRDAALSVAAMAIEALAELLFILADADAETEPKPLEPNVWREVWHWRISWTDVVDGAPAMAHVCQSWCPKPDDVWHEVSEAAESLMDLREMLRQMRAHHGGPRVVGEDTDATWQESLSRYDTKAAASAELDAALRRTPAGYVPDDDAD
jgi:hypothetical protein